MAPDSRPNGTGINSGAMVSPCGAAVFYCDLGKVLKCYFKLNSAVKEDENGADAQKHEVF